MRAVCHTCMHHCSLKPGQTGICGARKNRDGKVVCGNYGKVTAMGLDPIEKKPLKMFHPGSLVLSVGSYGCNLKCPFCQNHEIARMQPDTASVKGRRQDILSVSPKELADQALKYQSAGNIGVAFTYNEPLVGWEYVRDTAKLVKEAGMKTVLVTNGTASLEVLEAILPFMDAMNIDLKGFRAAYYQKLAGDFETVKAFIARASEACHVELTTLVVPGENDSVAEMEEEAGWIAFVGQRTGREIPLHVTRFFPRYQMMDRNATQVSQVYRLAEVAGKYLSHVFVGNC